MLRTTFVAALTLSSTLALADTSAKPVAKAAISETSTIVRNLPGQAAAKVNKSTSPVIGCGLNEIDLTSNTEATEGMNGFNEKTLLKASTGLPNAKKTPPQLKGVWGWCVKPDLMVRAWAACTGMGDSSTCAIYAAPIDAKGKLGKVARQTAGWATPKVEDVDSGKATAVHEGKVLKVTFEAGRGDGFLGVYVDNGAVKFTKVEWAQ